MPITPAFEWQESTTWVTIVVKIPNVTRNSADIMTTDCYVKVNSAPYFFELDLLGNVDSEKSQASVGQSEVKFFLVKQEPGLWEHLTMKCSDFKVRLERRERSLQAVRAHREKLRKEYPAKFSNIGRLAVGEHMRLEEMKRKVIEERKMAEHVVEQEKINQWKSFDLKCRRDSSNTINDCDDATPSTSGKRSIPRGKIDDKRTSTSAWMEKTYGSTDGRSITQDAGTFETIRRAAIGETGDNVDVGVEIDCAATIDGCDTEDDVGSSDQTISNPRVKDLPLPEHDAAEICDVRQPACINKKGVALAECTRNANDRGALRYSGVNLPAPRSCSTVSIAFSPKPDLPKHLPARESREREIKLRKSTAMREDTLDVSERAPLFLQDKGDKFFRDGNFQSAINAYTDALAQDSSLVVSLANRAACKLRLKDCQACVEDCSVALAVLAGSQGNAEEFMIPKTAHSPNLNKIGASGGATHEATKDSSQGGGLSGDNSTPEGANVSSGMPLLNGSHQPSNVTTADDNKAPRAARNNSDTPPTSSCDICTLEAKSHVSNSQREKERSLYHPSTEFDSSTNPTKVPQPPIGKIGNKETPEVIRIQGQERVKYIFEEEHIPLAQVSENSGLGVLSAAKDPVAKANSQQTHNEKVGTDHLWLNMIPIERLELLCCLSGEGCCSTRGLKVEGAGVEEWKASMRKHLLVRRAVARCHLGDALKAADDFRKVLQIDPRNQSVVDALAAIPI